MGVGKTGDFRAIFTVYLKVEYLADGARVFNCTKHSNCCRSLSARLKLLKKLGVVADFFGKKRSKVFYTSDPVVEIKPNTFNLQ